jgi:menaquinone-dependent protoporphyrinogen oxidase
MFQHKDGGNMIKTVPQLVSKPYTKHRIINSIIFMFMLTSLCTSSVAGSTVLFEKSCGSDNISGKKVLVAYDSKHGSTAMIAETIGDTLCENGFQVDIRLALNIDDISDYDAIVIGSPMYYANFLPGTLSFLERHRTVLATKAVAVFAVSSSVDKETGTVNENLARMVKSSVLIKFPEIQITEPIGLMPGKFFYREIFPVEIINLKQSGFEELGDYLNFDIVRSWTEGLAGMIQ